MDNFFSSGINAILKLTIGALSYLLPKIGIPQNFINTIDGALATIINFINGASYFLPLTVMVICFGCILTIDYYKLALKIGMFVIKLIRG